MELENECDKTSLSAVWQEWSTVKLGKLIGFISNLTFIGENEDENDLTSNLCTVKITEPQHIWNSSKFPEWLTNTALLFFP